MSSLSRRNHHFSSFLLIGASSRNIAAAIIVARRIFVFCNPVNDRKIWDVAVKKIRKKKMVCQCCGKSGHNSRTCTIQKKVIQKKRKRLYLCSYCQDKAHNVRTCPKKKGKKEREGTKEVVPSPPLPTDLPKDLPEFPPIWDYPELSQSPCSFTSEWAVPPSFFNQDLETNLNEMLHDLSANQVTQV